MSEYHRESGKITLVKEDISFEEANEYCHNWYCKRNFVETDILPPFCSDWIEACENKHTFFLYNNNNLYWIHDVEQDEPYNSFIKISPTGENEDGEPTYEFITQYYDGGTYIQEMLNEALNNLNKISN